MIDELIARLEKATGRDRELDALIYLATADIDESLRGWTPRHDFGDKDHTYSFVIDEAYPQEDEIELEGILPFTASIDAARTLVPEGVWWCVSGPHSVEGGKYRGGPMRFDAIVAGTTNQHGATPAIALCIAARKAFATTPQGEKPKKVHDAHTSPEGGQKRSSVSTDDAAESAMAGRAHKQ